MLDGWWKGKRAGSGTIVWESRRLLAEGKIDYDEFMSRVCSSAPSLGPLQHDGHRQHDERDGRGAGHDAARQLGHSRAVPRTYGDGL